MLFTQIKLFLIVQANKILSGWDNPAAIFYFKIIGIIYSNCEYDIV